MAAPQPVLWSEIKAYAEATGAIVEPWEMRLVREMSSAYVRELQKGESIFVRPPGERQSAG